MAALARDAHQVSEKSKDREPASVEEIVKRILIGTVLAALLATTAGIASASTATPRLDRRQWRQDVRIDRGIASGQLTPAEVARVRAGQTRVRRMELIARTDGVVTQYERFQLVRARNHQSRTIYRLAHNNQTM